MGHLSPASRDFSFDRVSLLTLLCNLQSYLTDIQSERERERELNVIPAAHGPADCGGSYGSVRGREREKKGLTDDGGV